jgi:hypothetical protein
MSTHASSIRFREAGARTCGGEADSRSLNCRWCHLWQGEIKAFNIAYASGVVKQVTEKDLLPRYRGNFWNWR